MEEVAAPNNHEQMTLMNFSFEQYGFEFDYIREFEFGEEFDQPDPGQMQQVPTALDEQDLLNRLRDKEKRNSPTIPQTIYDFYDKCKKHFCEEFMSLLIGLISNIESIKKLQNCNSEERLLEFFNIQLKPLNFGKHQVFADVAAECEAEIKPKLKECGKEIQLMVHAWREKSAAAARIKLQACSEDFKTFGEEEWMRQCKKTSRYNILDQHFAVKSHKLAEEDASENDDDNTDEFSVPKQQDAAPFKLWKASAWLYQVIIHDSKLDIDKDIRRRRAQSLKSQREAAERRARQAQVDVRADAAKPEVTLGNHLRLLDRRLDTMSVDISLVQASSQAQGRALTTDDASRKTDDSAPAPLQQLQRTVVQLQRQVQTLQLSASPATSKNDVGAGSAEMQIPAVKRHRRKRSRTEVADANTADTKSSIPQARTTAPQHPRQPAPNHASGNGRNASQQHRDDHHGSQRQARGPAQSRDNAPQSQDGRWRHDKAKSESQAAHDWGGRGRGQGRGQGRGY